MARAPKLTTAIVMMLRHRAQNYAQALADERAEAAAHRLRTLLHDMLTPDVVDELTAAWLLRQQKQQRSANAAKRRPLTGVA